MLIGSIGMLGWSCVTMESERSDSASCRLPRLITPVGGRSTVLAPCVPPPDPGRIAIPYLAPGIRSRIGGQFDSLTCPFALRNGRLSPGSFFTCTFTIGGQVKRCPREGAPPPTAHPHQDTRTTCNTAQCATSAHCPLATRTAPTPATRVLILPAVPTGRSLQIVCHSSVPLCVHP